MFRVWGLGIRVQGLRFRVLVSGLGLRVSGLWGLGCSASKVQGLRNLIRSACTHVDCGKLLESLETAIRASSSTESPH